MDTAPYVFSALSLVVAVLSLALAAVALRKGFRDSSVAAQENDFRARRQYNAEVRRWSDGCTTALSDAVYLAFCGYPEQKPLYDTISALSALVEQGRLFFPNRFIRSSTNSATPAREGWRPRILDWLIFSLRICAAMTPERDPEAEEVLKRMQAGFTSDVQLLLDPLNPFCKMSDLPNLLLAGEFMDASQQHPYLVEAKELLQQRQISSHGDSTFRS